MEYLTEEKSVNVDFALAMFAESKYKAIKRCREFNMTANNDICLEIISERKTISDKEAKKLVSKQYNIELALLHNEEPKTLKEVFKYLKGLDGPSVRQLSRLTGFIVNKIYKA